MIRDLECPWSNIPIIWLERKQWTNWPQFLIKWIFHICAEEKTWSNYFTWSTIYDRLIVSLSGFYGNATYPLFPSTNNVLQIYHQNLLLSLFKKETNLDGMWFYPKLFIQIRYFMWNHTPSSQKKPNLVGDVILNRRMNLDYLRLSFFLKKMEGVHIYGCV